MGKPQAAKTDAADLEERRRVARELNEATSDAREILRILQRESKELHVQLQKDFDNLITPAMNKVLEDLSRIMAAGSQRIAERTQELLGVKSDEELFKRLVDEILGTLREPILETARKMATDVARMWLEQNVKIEKLAKRGAAVSLTYERAIPGEVGLPGLEPGTSALSGRRSDLLSYSPRALLSSCGTDLIF